ncbi:MAG: hypothetical protein Sylvanvirus5_5 [Sylvanvirus sp.]|uniref:Uncharacterized protein n=1 Tax=Sylvanvirus sp. TaxID=2487774 RepID=A0A3G5AHG5_9VIRU|nr:MAG: hypothetical protein Sylvanvirus5_5 [Sylvanvirus sp.]
MFPFDITSPPPVLLSSISFNLALQQLFNAISSLLAHQHDLSLSLSVNNESSLPRPSLSYADVLKSSSKRPSFSIRQITPIGTVKPSRSCPPSPSSSPSPSPVSPPAPVPVPVQTQTSLSSSIQSVPVITPAPAPTSVPVPVDQAPSIVVPDIAANIDIELPMDKFSLSIRRLYPPVTTLCPQCEIYPKHVLNNDPSVSVVYYVYFVYYPLITLN